MSAVNLEYDYNNYSILSTTTYLPLQFVEFTEFKKCFAAFFDQSKHKADFQLHWKREGNTTVFKGIVNTYSSKKPWPSESFYLAEETQILIQHYRTMTMEAQMIATGHTGR